MNVSLDFRGAALLTLGLGQNEIFRKDHRNLCVRSYQNMQALLQDA